MGEAYRMGLIHGQFDAMTQGERMELRVRLGVGPAVCGRGAGLGCRVHRGGDGMRAILESPLRNRMEDVSMTEEYKILRARSKFDHFDPKRTIVKMSDGNPGAMNAMVAMLQVSTTGSQTRQWCWEMVKICDELEIYGSRLYQLWNDCFDRSYERMADCAMGYRAGKISAAFIREKIQGDGCRGFGFEPSEVWCG